MINRLKTNTKRGVSDLKKRKRSPDDDPQPRTTTISGTNSPTPGLTTPQSETDGNLATTSGLRSASHHPSHNELPSSNPESATQPSTTGPEEGFHEPATLINDENRRTYSNQHIIPVETPAPIPIARSSATLSNWKGLKSLASVLKSGTSTVAPLKAAVDVISEFVTTFEGEASSRQQYEGLETELDSLCQDLAGLYVTSAPSTMSLSIESLSKGIEREVAMVQQKKQRSKIGRYAEAARDADEVSECYRRIHLLLSRIALNANMDFRRVVDEQATKSRLKDLPYSPDARFRSAKSTSLYRGGCTPNTRVAVQEKLRLWAYDENSEKIFWLNGMAGTGKTTIAYSLCEHLVKSLTLAGSFFCSRQLPECRDVNLIFPSIAYQLALFSPPFRFALSRILERDPEAHNQPLVDQLDALILDPLREVEGTLPSELVVVIDALDECEDVQGVDLILSALLSNASKLPIRFLVTSRPEPQIYDRMKSRPGNRTRFELYLHELDRSVVKEDIRTYLETKLQPISLNAVQLDCLCEQAGVLFIYAATVVRYISADNFFRSAARLDLVLDVSTGWTQLASRGIDALYSLIMKAAFADREEWEHSEMESVLWAVICAQEPLTVKVIAGLLGLGSAELVQTALRPLSVLNISKEEELVTTLHESFPDFMFDKIRSDAFHCNAQERHGKLAQRCFDLIRTPAPPFNICNFESSYILDKDVPELETRVDLAISPELFYACRYWAAHMTMGNQSKGLQEGFYEFLNRRLMLWMEIMNVKKSLAAGGIVLSQLGTWSETSQCSKGARDLIKDAWKFLVATRGSPAAESTPHIYISMLTFWPKERPLSMTYHSRLRDLPKISGTGLETRNRAPLLTLKSAWPVSCAIYSPCGAYVASASTKHYRDKDGCAIQIWDTRTSEMIGKPLEGHTDSVNSVGYSPDGTRIVSGSSDYTIRIWDAGTGEMIGKPIEGHTGSVWSVGYSPDGTRIVSGSSDHTIRIWDAATGEMIGQPIEGHTDIVCSVGYSPDGTRIVSGSEDHTIRIWDVDTGEMIGEPMDCRYLVESVGYSPDGTRIVVGSEYYTIRLWDANTGKMIGNPMEGHTDIVCSVCYSPDGKRIVSGSWDYTIRIWDADTGEMIGKPIEGHTSRVQSVSYSPDGTRIVSGSWDATIRIWDTNTSKMTGTPIEGHTDEVISVGYSPDGKRIVSGSDDYTIRIWDADTGELIGSAIEGPEDSVNSVGYSPDGRRIVSGSGDHTIRIWDADTGEMIGEPIEGYKYSVSSVGYSPDGTRIVSGSLPHTIQIWDADTGGLIGKPIEGHTDWVNSVGYSPDGTRVISGSSDCTIRIWDVNTSEMIGEPMDHRSPVWSVGYSPDGTRIVSGSNDHTIRIWDANTGEMVGKPIKGHTNYVRSVGYSPDGTRIVSGSEDHTICIWDANTGEMVGKPIEGHTNSVRSVGYSPDGTRIVSGSSDHIIRIWDSGTGKMIGKPIKDHTSPVHSVGYSPDATRTVSIPLDPTIICDVAAGQNLGKPLQCHTDSVDSVGYTSESTQLVTGSSEQVIRTGDVCFDRISLHSPGEARTTSVQSVAALSLSGLPLCLPHDDTLPSFPYSADPHANWVLNDNGWVVTEDSKLLIWVPPELRAHLMRPRNTHVISRYGSVSIDFSNAAIGESWRNCYSP